MWCQSSECSEASCQSRGLQVELVRTWTYGRGMRQRMGCEGYKLTPVYWRPQKRHCPNDHSMPTEPWILTLAQEGGSVVIIYLTRRCLLHYWWPGAIHLSIRLPLTQWLQRNSYLSKFIEGSIFFLYVVFFQPHNSIWIVHPFERPFRGLKILQ